MTQKVLIVSTLKDFQIEVSPATIVYLLQTEKHHGKGIHSALSVALDLHGLNERGDIVWLNTTTSFTPSDKKLWNQAQQDIYPLLEKRKEIITKHLQKLGYTVRTGQYGINENIKPIRGNFECYDIIKQDGVYKLIEGEPNNWKQTPEHTP